MRYLVIGIFLLFFCDTPHAESKPGFDSSAMILVRSGNKVSNGVLVTSAGHAITAGHSLIRNKKVSVLVKGRWIPVDVIYHSKRQDIALLKISEVGPWPSVKLGPRAKIDQSVVLKTLRLQEGAMFVKENDLYSKNAIVQLNSMNIYPKSNKLDAEQVFSDVMVLGVQSSHGDSGGGVYNKDGQLVGLITTTNGATKKKMTIVQSLSSIKRVLELENVGKFTAKTDKLDWFLDGLSKAAREAAISESTISELKKKVKRKSQSISLQKSMDFAFAQFYRIIKQSKQRKVVQG